VRVRVIALIALAALSMVAPSAIGRLGSIIHSPILMLALAPWAFLPAAAAWFWIYVTTYRAAKIHRKKLRWLLVLTPFALCYPGWYVIVMTCGLFFNWCGGPPL
jgi:hypothetical protein